jgi:2-dehydropantoate 2-reductase
MSLDDPVIAVIGAGALGGYYGARMIQHGFNAHLLSPGDCAAIRRDGMRIRSRDGDFSLSPKEVRIYDDPRQMPPADLVVVTLKTTANHRMAQWVGPVVKEDSIILTLQNGLGNEELLGDLFGPERIVGGMAFVCINRTAPGQISHTDHGMIRIGEPLGAAVARTRKIARIFSDSGIPCEALDDLTHGRWNKLIWNLPFNGLGAALNRTTDQLIGSSEGLWLVRRLCEEVIAACRPLNIHFDFNVIEEKIRHTQTMGAYKTSMQIDRQLGRPMEIDAIVGRPLRLAEANAVSVPYMSMLYNMLSVLNGCGAIK